MHDLDIQIVKMRLFQLVLVATKRILGHPYESDEVRSACDRMAYEIAPSPLGSVVLRVGDRELTPVQVAARVLNRIREIAARELGAPVDQAVISVPAHFNEVQRRANAFDAAYCAVVAAGESSAKLPQMFARLALPLGHSRGLLIPQAAVHTVGQLTMVNVVTDKTAHLRQIKLGRQLGDQVEVLAGLQPGERIVLADK